MTQPAGIRLNKWQWSVMVSDGQWGSITFSREKKRAASSNGPFPPNFIEKKNLQMGGFIEAAGTTGKETNLTGLFTTGEFSVHGFDFGAFLSRFLFVSLLSLWGTYLDSTQRHIGSPNAQSTQVFTSKQPGSHTPSANVQIHVFLEFRPQMIWTMTSSSRGPYHISLAPEGQMSSSGIFPHKSQSRCLGRMMVSWRLKPLVSDANGTNSCS